jgi:LmbE family N-acetylglucosaminyl deacetylase
MLDRSCTTQVILTFGPDSVSGHSDHIAISNIVTQAFDLTYKKGMLLYIHPSGATVLDCGVYSTEIEDRQPLVEVDISDYKLEKIRVIQCHASQNPTLLGKPEDVTDKIPCSELYTVARDIRTKDNCSDWFETASVEQIYGKA